MRMSSIQLMNSNERGRPSRRLMVNISTAKISKPTSDTALHQRHHVLHRGIAPQAAIQPHVNEHGDADERK